MALFYILVFPGFLFLSTLSFWVEYFDRKFCAKLQNRVGPPWFQPLADFVKLLAKEDIMPEEADTTVFHLIPTVALTATITTIFYIPLWGTRALLPFPGDLIIVLYLLTVPTFCFFLGGWYSRSVYAMIGAGRALIQLFAYEVPLLMAILAAALLANSWSISEISVFYATHPWLALCNIVGFGVALVALLGKLEKVPFDIPEAETEIVAGCFTEYGGRLLALLNLTRNIEEIVGAALLAAVFLPFGLSLGPVPGFCFFILKVFLVVALISVLRTIMARLRIDQMIELCWKTFAPLAFFQVLLNLILKGVIRS